VAASSVVQVTTAPFLPMARVDTPLITGAVLSIGSGSSVIGDVGICGAAGGLLCDNELTPNIAPAVIAARHTSPIHTISHLFIFLMRTSGCG